MTNEKVHPVTPDGQGQRLDRFLSRAAGVSLRAARRAVEEGSVLVDGRRRGAAWKLAAGQSVSVAFAAWAEGAASSAIALAASPCASSGHAVCPSPDREPGPRLLTLSEGFAAFFKPSGLHSVALAGGGGPSLEALLPTICPGRRVSLVNRLDRDTSGIVLGALDDARRALFRSLEERGLVDKRYLAVATGLVDGPLRLDRRIEGNDRARVRVTDEPGADPLRVTEVTPIRHLPELRPGGATLIEARILKGARHQIRAHLARAGHPLLGDALYGWGDDAQNAGRLTTLRLHHWKVTFPDFCASVLPRWDEVQVLPEQFTKRNPCAS